MTREPDFLSNEGEVVRIVGDGAIMAAGQVGGTSVPVVLLDLIDHPDVIQAMEAHAKYDEGDVEFFWGKGRRKTVGLRLKMVRPVTLTLDLFFDPATQGNLIDWMIQARAVYLRSAVPGDNMLSSDGNVQLLLGLPHTGFEVIWEKMYADLMTKKIRKQRGVSQRKASQLATDAISELRGLSGIRFS
ncbi:MULTISPECIES: hypothetical protein [Nocardiaceae]|uniref:hypothetical protein n=1 Tax=Nocardiaceae TaxID=85025 RepID=UPI0005602CFF|nr:MULTISPECIES: hypothetical protein [Rhodococcus]OZD12004.1 hypothetical protein CH248_28765 [Rhodococcus sp. 06-156-4a]OZD15769.1 hypothetical protein CH253_22645 [Rhodococcus sp. 06-156-3C]OZD21153.1 hypothetical protein CH280_02875 [Rhodococcus sp. 06-156-4C]OZD32335.1 hypothetical protein CH284_20805 [Rhodococcus sp. 06-156-3]OZD36557.1 hypothetical protein CH247_03230 [Rhodococcus sp. 06-156-3b]